MKMLSFLTISGRRFQRVITVASAAFILFGVAQHGMAQNQVAPATPPLSATPTPIPSLSVINPALSIATVSSAQIPLSLEQSIKVALTLHGDVGAAEQGFVGARETITSARSNYFPQITTGLNYDYTQRGTNVRTGSGGTIISPSLSNSQTTTDITVSQNIFDAGRTRQQVRQARARALNAAGGLGTARNTLAFEVSRAFYEQLRQEKLVAQRRGQVQLAQQQLLQIQAQIEIGVAARVDAQSIQVNLSQSRFDLVTSENDLRVAQTTFRNTLGLERGPSLPLRDSMLAAENAPVVVPIGAGGAPVAVPEGDATPTTGLTENPAVSGPDTDATLAAPVATPLPFPTAAPEPLPVVPQLKPLEVYLAEAQRLRPDLVQSRAAIQQSEAAVSLAKIASRPQVTASAGYNIDPRSPRDRGFAFGAGISIPLFNAGGRKADVRAAEADLEASRIRLDQLGKDVASDVETAFVAIGGQVERIANARALVEAARLNLETSTERYRLGLGIVLDIVNAQIQLFSAQTSATQAVYDYELARANLERALGRYAWANPDQVPPPQAPSTASEASAAVAQIDTTRTAP